MTLSARFLHFLPPPRPLTLRSFAPSLRLALALSARRSREVSYSQPRLFASCSRHTSFPRSRLRASAVSSRDIHEGDDGAVKGNDIGRGILVDASDSNSIIPVELHKEATDSYLAYALSVLIGRALPDVRDGLKPVHRRILFAMHELGLSSKRPFKKCARVVGEVLGKFHPHGDSAVYGSLVRMAQDFSLRFPLIKGHGNFGSLDGDPAAAMRYTECRLEELSEAMLLADIEENTVDFVQNFDASQKEPTLLPARLPLFLLNGASGIAVGMATSIPPHNLGEIVNALIAFIRNPDATVQELMEYMPGPDFPTGGRILGNNGILEAYRTGRGAVTIRGKTEIEVMDEKNNRLAIIIREVPYQTNKAALVQRIAELVDSKDIDGISDIRDESDRSGIRILLELKKGSDPSIILNNLYKHTALQTNFNCNIVGIVDGQPRLIGIREMFQAFVEFRCSVVERRAMYQLRAAEEREHVLKGVLVGLDNVDNVIGIIRKSKSNAEAIRLLKEGYSLSERQAEAVLDISLRRLTVLERTKYVEEQKALAERILHLKNLLADKEKILQVIVDEALELQERFDTPRRSVIEETEKSNVDDLDIIPNEEMLLALTERGYMKRMKTDNFTLQHRGTVGKSLGKLKEHDAMSEFLTCRAHDHILYFSDKGVVYSARAFRVPECSRTAAGTPLVRILSLSSGEKVTSIIPVSEFNQDQYLLMLTAKGYIKRVSLSLFSSIRSTGIIAIQLVAGDELKWVRQCTGHDHIAIGSQGGRVLLSSCGKVRSLSRTSRGVTSMRLRGEDRVAAVDIVSAAMQEELHKIVQSYHKHTSAPWLLLVTENGYGKRVPLRSFKALPLNRVGLTAYKLMPDDRLAALFVVGLSLSDDGESDEQVILVSHSGTLNRIMVRDISIQSRLARGVILMRLEYGGKIQSVSVIGPSEVEKENSEQEESNA
eukprot:TRINITY_DN16447_c0_g1_i1.p1 TRINITY_DN16447_c0_g1~~TRINITY_DN16447_c0_g1_i1.p1  ORF type:complete len:942 (-),score=173.08 TRINITY_DN16447_c0_g1_i1:51-2876(-)